MLLKKRQGVTINFLTHSPSPCLMKHVSEIRFYHHKKKSLTSHHHRSLNIKCLSMDINFLNFISIITTLINLVAAFFIARRMESFERNLQTIGLERNSPYKTIMEIWVESAALIVLFSIVCLALAFFSYSPVSFIFMECLVHINVRAFLVRFRSTGNLTFIF